VQIVTPSKTASIMQCPGTLTAATLSDFLAKIRREAPWHAPIFRALLVGEIAMCMPLPQQRLPVKELDRLGKPVIVMICDDGPIWTGPQGWECATRALRWAGGAMLHGSGGEVDHYRFALVGAERCRRFVIVDTSSAHLPEWEALASAHIGNRQILSVKPLPGHSHPAVDGDHA
jgi:hypothetical protein